MFNADDRCREEQGEGGREETASYLYNKHINGTDILNILISQKSFAQLIEIGYMKEYIQMKYTSKQVKVGAKVRARKIWTRKLFNGTTSSEFISR